jgi:Alpha/beta hydrolase domain
MRSPIRHQKSLALLCASLLFVVVINGCSDGNDNSPTVLKPQAVNPTVQGPISGGGAADCCVINFGPLAIDLRTQGYVPGTPFYAGLNFDEAEVGYLENEYFFSGTAISYMATDELHSDGVWSLQEADTAEYTSRIVVLRPINDADFNGTVVVEWFNVSGGVDAAPDWTQMHTELIREGYAWVGVSAQRAGVEGGGAFDLPLKQIDAERYKALQHPGDSFSYDIFSQAAQAVRNPVGLDPLGGLSVERMIAVGESQSAFRLVTYVNAVHPIIDLFDGFIIHSRGNGSAPLSQMPQVAVATPDPVFIREDLPEPVLTLQTQTDIFRLNSVTQRQQDTPSLRLWEVAGSAHSDVYTTLKGPIDRGDDPTVADVVSNNDARPPFITCPLPVNDGPGHWVAKAAIAAVDHWIRTGEAAPAAPLLTLNSAGTNFEFDSFGNALGGVRTPHVDAPVATLSGEGQPPANAAFCGLFGTTVLFDDAMLSRIYPGKQAYVDAIDSATDAAVAAGFIRPADAQLIKARARTSSIAVTAVQ